MKWLVTSAVTFLLFFHLIGIAHALTLPKPGGYVNDFANLYSEQFEHQLETDLESFDKKTTSEVSVVTVTDLQEITIDDYAVRLFEEWKIGKKGKDNGVLLLIAKTEREVRIEVGYGLESQITDSRAGRTIREVITPHFRKDDYEGGTREGVTRLEQYILKEVVPEESVSQPDQKFDPSPFIVPFFVFLTYFTSYMARSKEFIAGGVIGAVAGFLLGSIFASLL